MEPEKTQSDGSPSHKKLFIILGVAVLFLMLAAAAFYVIVVRGNGNIGEGIRNILPFGGESPDAQTPGGRDGDGRLGDVDVPGGAGSRNRFFKIEEGPVSGSVVKVLPNGGYSVRYVMREDGDVHEYLLDDREGRLLANNTIPRVAEAVWDARGTSVVLRTANEQEDIVSILGKLAPNAATTTGDEAPAVLIQEYLPENIDFIAPGPSGGFAHTLPQGNSLAVALLGDSGVSRSIFVSPFTEWIPEWPSSGMVAIATRPSGAVGGYLFTIDPDSGRVDPILNDFKGLTARTAPSGAHALVGGADRGQMTLALLDLGTALLDPITPATLPEKCAWTASSTVAYCGVPQSPERGTYPDAWYQGIAAFSDTIWAYAPDTRQFSLLAIPQNEGADEVDIMNPTMSPDGSYLIFTNKRDGALWGLDLRIPAGAIQEEP